MNTVRCFSSGISSIGNKLAMFDLDGTIIKTKSGEKFSVGSGDWEFLYPEIKPKLKELYNKGHSIIIISNQAKFSPIIEEKIKSVLIALEVPVQAFVATGKDKYRKPETGIFEELILPKITNLTNIFFIGDAAGRKNDFSDFDRKFAYNIFLFLKYKNLKDIQYKIGFQTPEEYFLKANQVKRIWRGIDPLAYLEKRDGNNKGKGTRDILLDKLPNGQKLIVLIGYPASGKSSLCKLIDADKNMKIVNQDECRTKVRCLRLVEKSLSDGHSVIVDRTNPSVADRAEFVQLAALTNSDIHIIAIKINRSKELCEHLNIMRERLTGEPRIPKLVYRIFDSKYEKPTINEGFESVLDYTPKLRFTSPLKLMRYMQRSE
jgi:bifunctional polynucleotide phosphatase/kinase